MFSKLKKLFHRVKRPDLRTKCVELYGKKFGKIYDAINQGIPVGGFIETVVYLEMVEEVRRNFKCK